jgi:hypothetical protein
MSGQDSERWRYGLWAVLGGSIVILLVCAVAIIKFDSARDVGTAVGPAIAAIAALTGAYFGVQAGSAGKDAADTSRDAAQMQALQFAAVADPDRALAVMHIGSRPPDDGGGGGPGPASGASRPEEERELLRQWDEFLARSGVERGTEPQAREEVKVAPPPDEPRTRAAGAKE